METKNVFAKYASMNKKAQAFGVRAVAITIVTGGAIFLVGVLIFSKISASIDTSGLTVNETAVVNQVKSTTLDSFELAIISLIVIAAVGVLGALFMLGRG
jgi:ABC-type Fe3+ transport system permease subunit